MHHTPQGGGRPETRLRSSQEPGPACLVTLSSSFLVHDLQSFGLDNVRTRRKPWRADGMETGLCSCLKWEEITLCSAGVQTEGRDSWTGAPQQKEARSKARMKCDISRKPPGWI